LGNVIETQWNRYIHRWFFLCSMLYFSCIMSLSVWIGYQLSLYRRQY
jgi:hypothetical protein